MKKKTFPTLKYALIGSILGILFLVGTLLYSQNFTLVGWVDATSMSFFMLFALGWFLFISNEGLLDILIYGVQSFGKAMIGKRMKTSYIVYTQDKERLPKAVFLGFWLASLLYLIAFGILALIYY